MVCITNGYMILARLFFFTPFASHFPPLSPETTCSQFNIYLLNSRVSRDAQNVCNFCRLNNVGSPRGRRNPEINRRTSAKNTVANCLTRLWLGNVPEWNNFIWRRIKEYLVMQSAGARHSDPWKLTKMPLVFQLATRRINYTKIKHKQS